jgi:putative phosphoesterase
VFNVEQFQCRPYQDVTEMRIAVISDIHGNQTALEAVLRDLAQQSSVDQTIVAGDLCLNGPRPKEVLKIVNKLHCPVIQGNVDAEVVNEAVKKGSRKSDVVSWTRAQIGRKGLDYLASLPFSYRVQNPEGGDLLVVHANPLDLEQAIFPTDTDEVLEPLLSGLDPTIGALAFGHLHIAYTRLWHHLLLCDVGSCGLPRDEDTRASYAILTWEHNGWQAEIRRVDYDLAAVVQQLQESDIPHVEKRIKILTEAKY